MQAIARESFPKFLNVRISYATLRSRCLGGEEHLWVAHLLLLLVRREGDR